MPDPSGAARAPQTTDELVAEVKAALQSWRDRLVEVQALPGRTSLNDAFPVEEVLRAAHRRVTDNAGAWLGALVQAVEDQQTEVSRLRADGQRLREALTFAVARAEHTMLEDGVNTDQVTLHDYHGGHEENSCAWCQAKAALVPGDAP